jgi:hypothetical protein
VCARARACVYVCVCVCVCVCVGVLLNSVDIWQNRRRLDASPLWTLGQSAIASTHCRCEFCVEMHQHVSYLQYQGVIRNSTPLHRCLNISHNHADFVPLSTHFFLTLCSQCLVMHVSSLQDAMSRVRTTVMTVPFLQRMCTVCFYL